MRCLSIASIFVLASLSAAQEAAKPWTLEIESGMAAVRYNNARVPNSTGSHVDLAELAGMDWNAFGRFSLFYADKAGGTWKLLYAPFQLSGTGLLAGSTSFADATFSAGPAQASYRFDSYRLTYRKPWKGNWSVGGTLKIRDAEIRLKQGATEASESNVGLVPLLNIFGEGTVARGLRYEVELDGLAGGPGRAIDLSLRLKKQIDSSTEAFVGYRLLEGGADVPKVYNFAWINYITAGVSYRF